jgi:hypothetical protein
VFAFHLSPLVQGRGRPPSRLSTSLTARTQVGYRTARRASDGRASGIVAVRAWASAIVLGSCFWGGVYLAAGGPTPW